MPRAARQYDIYLPLAFNDGRPIPKGHFVTVERRLLAQFPGVTSQKREFPMRGIWVDQNHVYHDHVIVITCLDFRKRGSTRFIVELKQYLLHEFEQLEILITETSLRVH